MKGQTVKKFLDGLACETTRAIYDELCVDCKGAGPWWLDSDCRYYCDAFIDAAETGSET